MFEYQHSCGSSVVCRLNFSTVTSCLRYCLRIVSAYLLTVVFLEPFENRLKIVCYWRKKDIIHHHTPFYFFKLKHTHQKQLKNKLIFSGAFSWLKLLQVGEIFLLLADGHCCFLLYRQCIPPLPFSWGSNQPCKGGERNVYVVDLIVMLIWVIEVIKYLQRGFERKHAVTKETLTFKHCLVSHNKTPSPTRRERSSFSQSLRGFTNCSWVGGCAGCIRILWRWTILHALRTV